MSSFDRLTPLLERFRVRTHLLHTGPLCGVTRFGAEGRGYLHIVRSGAFEVEQRLPGVGVRRSTVTEPSLLFYPRPLAHDFYNPPHQGADFACATIDFEGGSQHPLARALPPVLLVPLAEVDGLDEALTLLFDFEWINRNYFFGLYRREASFFAGSELSSYGRPASEAERGLLRSQPERDDRLPLLPVRRPAAPPVSNEQR